MGVATKLSGLIEWVDVEEDFCIPTGSLLQVVLHRETLQTLTSHKDCKHG